MAHYYIILLSEDESSKQLKVRDVCSFAEDEHEDFVRTLTQLEARLSHGLVTIDDIKITSIQTIYC